MSTEMQSSSTVALARQPSFDIPAPKLTESDNDSNIPADLLAFKQPGVNNSIQYLEERKRLSENKVLGLHEDPDEKLFKTYTRRWFMLLIYCLLSFISSFIWITFASIQDQTKEFYSVGSTAVNMLSVLFSISYVPGFPLSSYAFSKWGTRNSLLIGGAGTAVGCGIRLLSLDSLGASAQVGPGGFAVVVLGQLIAALGQPFLCNAPARVSGDWFPSNQRSLATTLGAIFNPIGAALGTLVPSQVVGHDGTGFATLLWAEALVALAAAVLAFLFYEAAPPTPPSRSKVAVQAKEDRMTQKSPYYKDLHVLHGRHLRKVINQIKECLSDYNFVLVTCIFAMGLSVFNSVTTLIRQITKPAGYTVENAGTFGILMLGLGIASAGITGPLLDYTRRYNTFLKIYVLGSFAAVVFLCSSFRPDALDALSAAFALQGIFTVPVYAIAFECAAEITYPVSEDVAVGLLNIVGNIMGIITITVMGYLVDLRPEYDSLLTPVNLFMVLWVLCPAIMCIVYKGTYKRSRASGLHPVDDKEIPIVEHHTELHQLRDHENTDEPQHAHNVFEQVKREIPDHPDVLALDGKENKENKENPDPFDIVEGRTAQVLEIMHEHERAHIHSKSEPDALHPLPANGHEPHGPPHAQSVIVQPTQHHRYPHHSSAELQPLHAS